MKPFYIYITMLVYALIVAALLWTTSHAHAAGGLRAPETLEPVASHKPKGGPAHKGARKSPVAHERYPCSRGLPKICPVSETPTPP